MLETGKRKITFGIALAGVVMVIASVASFAMKSMEPLVYSVEFFKWLLVSILGANVVADHIVPAIKETRIKNNGSQQP